MQYSMDYGSTWFDWYQPYRFERLEPASYVEILFRGIVREGEECFVSNRVGLMSEIKSCQNWCNEIRIPIGD